MEWWEIMRSVVQAVLLWLIMSAAYWFPITKIKEESESPPSVLTIFILTLAIILIISFFAPGLLGIHEEQRMGFRIKTFLILFIPAILGIRTGYKQIHGQLTL
ncbi:hypothetical protein FBR05_04105 [Deltaproteobacteria bacterium PRO3]|nr:hypothetical protein [Deltaproteobacteria bacterium PRO3]